MNTTWYPVDVKAVGLMKCRKQKNYMMSVLWPDRNNVLIYRTFEEFKKFHKELKKKFPIEAGLLKKSERTIPKFKDAPRMQRKSGKLRRSLERLKLLELYSQELMKLDTKISQSEDVTQFFKAQTRDLDPSFPENSIIIMPSEFGDEKKKQLTQPSPSITYPVASQTYRCIETYETKDTKNRPFKVAKGEIVEVLIKDMTGWWLVENEDKQIAWFPAPYLEERTFGEKAPSFRESDEEGSRYYTVRAYKSQEADELSVNAGVIVEVLEKSDNGWWLIWYNGNTGYIPCMLLQPYKNPHSKFQTIVNAGLNASTPNLHLPSSPSSGSALPQANPQWGGLPQSYLGSERADKGRGSLSRNRSKSLPGLDTAASSSMLLEPDSSSVSSGSGSEQEVSQKPGSPSSSSGVRQGSSNPHVSCRDKNSLDLEEASSGSSAHPPCCPDPAASMPNVPMRPTTREILQKCSTVTRRAIERSAHRPSLLATPHIRP
ncbi:NADPH oxidase organizer 1 [Alligator mississippiensis]|uniref:NADPH oxidase organizer 1 n=1 Tax=Alligator mississippiensis TaxID=8496 RepID=A0A151N200_ALLMI|nr:NADPH oxidase organizer 1 [Alligator mississippiensis]